MDKLHIVWKFQLFSNLHNLAESVFSISHSIVYSNHLNTGVVWYSNGRFVPDCQMVWYSNGCLKTGLKKPIYCPKCPVIKWSIKSHDFTIWILNTHTVQFSDESGIQVFGIQLVTVLSIICFRPYCPSPLQNSLSSWAHRLFSMFVLQFLLFTLLRSKPLKGPICRVIK